MMSNEQIGLEMDTMAARAGLLIPADRRAGILSVYSEVRAMTELIRAQELVAEDEPANIYLFGPITRSA